MLVCGEFVPQNIELWANTHPLPQVAHVGRNIHTTDLCRARIEVQDACENVEES